MLVQGPYSDPLLKKHCMSNKKIISCFQYPVKTTVFTVSRKSFHTGCSNFICGYISTNDVFFAVQTSPNMIGLTVKKYHNQETTKFFFQSSWCSILYYLRLSQCGFGLFYAQL
jgi:hypothetical protein